MSTNVEDALKQTISDLEYIAQNPGNIHVLLEKRRRELSEVAGPSKEELLKRLQSARNYAYEATMGDYSMSSINRATAQVEEAKQALIDAGYEVPAW